MEQDQVIRAKQALRQGIPPENLEPFQIETESFKTSFYRLTHEMTEANRFNSKRLIAVVGQRGYGKTHLFKIVESHVRKENLPFILVNIDAKSTLIENFNEICRKMGLAFFYHLKRKALDIFNLNNDIDLYYKLLEITNAPMFSISIARLQTSDEPIIWKWLTSRIGLREINKVKIGKNRISRNLRDEDIIQTLFILAILCKKVLDKSLVIILDELAIISKMNKKENHNFKHFLVNFINSELITSMFILLGCTSASWEELVQEPYSVSIGLSRRLLSIELFGLKNFDEANMIGEKIINFYRETETTRFDIENGGIERIYDETNRNTGYFIRNLVAFIEKQIIDSRIFESLPFPDQVVNIGEEIIHNSNIETIKMMFWEYLKDLIMAYNDRISNENFASFFVCSVRQPRKMIEPSFSCTLNNSNFVSEIQIKINNGRSRIGIQTILPIISALRNDIIDFGIIFLIGNVIQDYTPGSRGSSLFLEDNRDIRDQVHFIPVEINALKAIIGYFILKREDPTILSNIYELDEITGHIYEKLSDIHVNYSPSLDDFYRQEENMRALTHLRYLESLRNSNYGKRLETTELIKFLRFIMRTGEFHIERLISAINFRLSDLNQTSEGERSEELKQSFELFELLTKKSTDRMEDPYKTIICSRNATIGNILLARCSRRDLQNFPTLHFKQIYNEKFIGILVEFDWFEKFVFIFRNYSSYSSQQSLEDSNRKLTMLLRNDFSSDTQFKNRFQNTILEESPRLFTISSLCRNYLQHPNPAFLAISDISTFQEVFDLILTSSLELFSIGRRSNLYPVPF
ncbi:MAG: hypothetical protein ACFFB5_06375 [Promethearchaeota archaeon]